MLLEGILGLLFSFLAWALRRIYNAIQERTEAARLAASESQRALVEVNRTVEKLADGVEDHRIEFQNYVLRHDREHAVINAVIRR